MAGVIVVGIGTHIQSRSRGQRHGEDHVEVAGLGSRLEGGGLPGLGMKAL